MVAPSLHPFSLLTMPNERPGFVNVDELLPQVTLEKVAAAYGFSLPDGASIERELRLPCQELFGCEKGGERSVAINAGGNKFFKCHQYGCEVRGNLLKLMYAMKHGQFPSVLRGGDFREIAADLRAIVSGEQLPSSAPVNHKATTVQETKSEGENFKNVPLAESENEAARGLVKLDEKLVVDVADMNKAASAYVRRRPFLTPDVMQRWRMGFMPGDAKSTLRGLIVYPMLSENGEPLAWIGRDPAFDEKHRKWLTGGKQGREPIKHRFPKGFHRGLELFGQDRLHPEGDSGVDPRLGLMIVEGPNDVIRLATLGVPSVGLCSNQMTGQQAEKIARWAKTLAGSRVTLMLDGDDAGQTGAKHALFELAKRGVELRMAPIAGEPENLTNEQWSEIHRSLLPKDA